MSCKDCKKKTEEFKRRLEMAKETKEVEKIEKTKAQLSEEKHFKSVCEHGVPNGFMCKGCDKVISIPEDAVVKE